MADSRARHSQHDLELVAAWAAGEATGDDLERAERLLDACDLCVGVARDLRAITLALQDLPAVDAMAVLPPAPRDYRLTPEQAARLRPGVGIGLGIGRGAPRASWTMRLAAGVAAFGKPVGGSLVAIGLVGLFVGATSLGLLGAGGAFVGGPTAAGSAPMAADLATAAPAPGGDGGAAGNVPAATIASGAGTEFGPGATRSVRSSAALPPVASAKAQPSTSAIANPGMAISEAGPAPGTWLLLASAAALIGGIGLIVVATRRG